MAGHSVMRVISHGARSQHHHATDSQGCRRLIQRILPIVAMLQHAEKDDRVKRLTAKLTGDARGVQDKIDIGTDTIPYTNVLAFRVGEDRSKRRMTIVGTDGQ